MKITENEIRRICSPTIYKRGLEYFKQGRVHLTSRNVDRITATVDGSEVYSVCVNFSGDSVTDTLCTCPYYKTMGSVCKHIVATLHTRRTEIEENGSFENENDMLAAKFCTEFEQQQKNEYHIALRLRISSVSEKNVYSVALTIYNDDSRFQLTSPESFIFSFFDGKSVRLSKSYEISLANTVFDAYSEKILLIFAEVCENKKTSSGIYISHSAEINFGASTAKRLFPLLGKIECEYITDTTQLKNIRIIDDNPDILVDINAIAKNITLSVNDRGFALVPDGSWFLYENEIYRTSESWRSWFMPIYRSVILQQRTQLEFSGDNCLEFASKVLPVLRHKQGVVCYGVDELIISETPHFEVYFDCIEKKITAVIKAFYGDASLILPCAFYPSEKVIIRNFLSENKILSFFDDFNLSDSKFILDDDDLVFNFIKKCLPPLYEIAEVYTSTAFENLINGNLPDIYITADYNKDIDLLELTLESELSEKELSAIFKSYCSGSSHYRFDNGMYADFEKNSDKLDFIQNMSFSGNKKIKGTHQISKLYSLYIAGQSDNVKTGDGFDEMISEAFSSKADIPDNIAAVLRDYQKTGVNWLHQLAKLGLGGILADDMGLGKTLQVIAFVMSEKKEFPALVVAPSSLIYNWFEEIHRFAPEATVKLIDGPKDERVRNLEDIAGYDFIITSYTLLRRDIELYRPLKFSYCFSDEAQFIKNAHTMNAAAIKKINSLNFFALTGTPVENSLSELWSIFDFVIHGYLGTQKEFSQMYDKINDKSLSKLRKKIKPFVLRRMKKDVLSELPEKIENTIFADFEKEQQKIYTAFLKAARKEIDDIYATGGNSVRILSLLTRLRQICCHPLLINPNYTKKSGKLELLQNLVSDAIKSGHRILIFSQFTSMLVIIKQMLDSENIENFYLDGSTPGAERLSMANRFNSGEKEVFLISLKAGGTGLNLVGADMVIHYDPWWNPAVMDQASDRAYRIGQTRAVQVIKLATHNSIEEQILKLAEKKRGLADGIIRENKSLLSALSREELLKLFE